MSLLDDLAFNSFVMDFGLQDQPTSHDPCSPPRNPSPSPNQELTKSSPAAHQTVLSVPISVISSNHSLQSTLNSNQDQYYLDYRQKLSKIGRVVTLLSAKTTKLKYQFMVHLERWCKSAPQPGPRGSEEQAKQLSRSRMTPSSQPIFFEKISRMHAILSRLLALQFRQGFAAISKLLRDQLKADFIQKVVQQIQKRLSFSQKLASIKLIRLCAFEKRQTAPEILPFAIPSVLPEVAPLVAPFSPPFVDIFPARSVLIPIIKNRVPRLNINEMGLCLGVVSISALSSVVLPLRPQPQERQQVDLCDTVALFMPSDQQLEVPLCLSPKSYIRDISDINLFNDQGQKEKTDLVSSAEEYASSKLSQLDFRPSLHAHHDSCRNVASPGTLFKHKQSNSYLLETVSPDHPVHPHKSGLFSHLQEEKDYRSVPSPEPIQRAKSEAKRESAQARRLSQMEIENRYKEDMTRYVQFKKILQEKRDFTLKEIQKSQETIKKLILKLSRSQGQQPKITSQKATARSVRDSSPRTDCCIKQRMSLKTSPKGKTKARAGERRRGEDKGRLTICPRDQRGKKKEQACRVNANSPESMSLLYHYISEKKKLQSEKSTPNRKTSKGSSTLKKKQPTSLVSSAQKNLLAISSFPGALEQRIDLRVDLGLGKADRRKGLGGQPLQKQKLTLGTQARPRPKKAKK